MIGNGMVPPSDIVNFYKRFDAEVPLTPEEEEIKKIMEEEEAKAKKKKKKDKKKAKKKGKKGKKTKDDDDPKKNIVMTGPSEVVQKFDEFFDGYNDLWANKDEQQNFDQ